MRWWWRARLPRPRGQVGPRDARRGVRGAEPRRAGSGGCAPRGKGSGEVGRGSRVHPSPIRAIRCVGGGGRGCRGLAARWDLVMRGGGSGGRSPAGRGLGAAPPEERAAARWVAVPAYTPPRFARFDALVVEGEVAEASRPGGTS